MNEMKKADTCIRRVIRSGAGMEDGAIMIRDDLRRVFRFGDVVRFSYANIMKCYEEFEKWLNNLIVARPMPDGIIAVNFGLYHAADGIEMYISGSSEWDMRDPDWAANNNWFPEDVILKLSLFKDIADAFSEFNHAGLYLAVAITALMIRHYTRHSIISLLDDQRTMLYIACGFDDGELYNIGKLYERGLALPDDARRGFFI